MSPGRDRLLRRIAPACLVLGAVLLVVFETTVTLLLGVVLLLAAVALGVALVAQPAFLEADRAEAEPEDAHPPSGVADPGRTG